MDKDLLLRYNAVIKNASKSEFIFKQGEFAHFFYLIITGSVRVFTLSQEGKEFTHKQFGQNQCIGMPPFFLNLNYPSSAQAIKNTKYLQISKSNFNEFLEDNPKESKKIIQQLCKVIYHKSIMSSEISMYDPEHRIITLFNELKTKSEKTKIELTRQEIANHTALRVETVIRHIKFMEEQGILEIRDRKVYY